jgi:hypothetical protein
MIRLAPLTFLLTALSLPAAPTSNPPPSAYPELLSKPFLFEVVRHLYRWYMDEADALKAARLPVFTFWVRDLRPNLDPGDRSRLGEIILPGFGIAVRVKQADYAIEETGIRVKNSSFKITNVARIDIPAPRPPGAIPVEVDYSEIRGYLFRTRSQVEYPEGDLLMRLRLAARKEIERELARRGAKAPEGEQIVHLSPLSPVANEAWAFSETGRLLIRFASDIDLADPAVWDHEELAVKTYDADSQVVVSLDEVAGSNAYLTRDQVGRVLFNCIILGRRLAFRALSSEDARKIENRDRGSP